jgi:LmbE family N-acetylglucosaminyl deacetylase
MGVREAVGALAGPSRQVLREQVMVPARSAWRWVWSRRGLDITATIAMRSCLVVAPHPDDETLGCAVAVMRKRDAGTPVTVVVVSDGARSEPAILPPAELVELRKAEARRACARLGVGEGDVVFLDFPDAGLSGKVDEVAGRLAELIRARSPEQLLVPVSCEGHPDHDATNEAARRAVESIEFRGQVLEYAVWLWTHWPWTLGYGTTAPWTVSRLLLDPLKRVRERRPLLVDARGYRRRQREALAEHTSQVGRGDDGTQPPVTGSLWGQRRRDHDAAASPEAQLPGSLWGQRRRDHDAAASPEAQLPGSLWGQRRRDHGAAAPPEAQLPGSLLATLRSDYEVYLEPGSLRHLDFARPWRGSPT